MDLKELLSERLEKPLPGFQAQKRMGPRLQNGTLLHDRIPSDSSRRNGIMLLFFKDDTDYRIILTQRSHHLPTHKGEICCPGGRIEQSETPLQAAIRETKEETGIPHSAIEIIGKLSNLYIPVTNNILIPSIGFLNHLPALVPNPGEVSAILTPQLTELQNRNNIREEIWKLHGHDVIVPFWNLFDTPLWGATAMILSELISVIEGE